MELLFSLLLSFCSSKQWTPDHPLPGFSASDFTSRNQKLLTSHTGSSVQTGKHLSSHIYHIPLTSQIRVLSPSPTSASFGKNILMKATKTKSQCHPRPPCLHKSPWCWSTPDLCINWRAQLYHVLVLRSYSLNSLPKHIAPTYSKKNKNKS